MSDLLSRITRPGPQRWALIAGILVIAIGAAAFWLTSPKTPKVAEDGDALFELLMQPGELADVSLGAPDAKVTVVEFGSMTCSHCANFAKNVWPEFKKKYVDTGKVRYIFREFPTDDFAAVASMVARCAGGDKTFPLIDSLFEKQELWAFAKVNRVPKLFEVAKQAGFTQEQFDKCLKDQTLLDKIRKEQMRAIEIFGVRSTPTFFINGKRLEGVPAMSAFDKLIEPLLATKS